MGQRIHTEVLGNERAIYGEQIIATLSRQLVAEYGRGYTEKSLHRMIQFAEAFPDEQIVASLWRQLSWSHFRELLPLKKPFQRDFYAQMCRIERWSVRTLRERIDSMLYERTALSKKPDEQIELLELDKTGIHVAEYLTVLPPREEFEQRLHLAIVQSKALFENREDSA